MLDELAVTQLYVNGYSIMSATEILKVEHRLIERCLSALERATDRLGRGDDVYLRFFAGTAFFINRYIDGHHHHREEEALFPSLVDMGLSRDSDLIARMLADHAEGRRLVLLMKQATERYQAGDEKAKAIVVKNATEFIRLQRQHINIEDNILFPLAEKLIPANLQQEMQTLFTHLEYCEDGEEFNQKYRGLVERLEKECIRSE